MSKDYGLILDNFRQKIEVCFIHHVPEQILYLTVFLLVRASTQSSSYWS